MCSKEGKVKVKWEGSTLGRFPQGKDKPRLKFVFLSMGLKILAIHSAWCMNNLCFPSGFLFCLEVLRHVLFIIFVYSGSRIEPQSYQRSMQSSRHLLSVSSKVSNVSQTSDHCLHFGFFLQISSQNKTFKHREITWCCWNVCLKPLGWVIAAHTPHFFWVSTDCLVVCCVFYDVLIFKLILSHRKLEVYIDHAATQCLSLHLNAMLQGFTQGELTGDDISFQKWTTSLWQSILLFLYFLQLKLLPTSWPPSLLGLLLYFNYCQAAFKSSFTTAF